MYPPVLIYVFPYFPVSFCFPLFPMFSPVFLRSPLYFPVFPCFLMFSPVFTCFPSFPMFSCVFPYIPLFSNVFPCILLYSHVFLCLPLYPPVFQCFPLFPIFSPVFLVFPFSPLSPVFPCFPCLPIFSLPWVPETFLVRFPVLSSLHSDPREKFSHARKTSGTQGMFSLVSSCFPMFSPFLLISCFLSFFPVSSWFPLFCYLSFCFNSCHAG